MADLLETDRPEASASPRRARDAGDAAELAPHEDPELDEFEPAQIDQPDDRADLDDVEAARIELADDLDGEADAPEKVAEKLAVRAASLSPDRLRNIVEALLFVTDKPLTLEILREATGAEVPALKATLEVLRARHVAGASGIVLHEVSHGWQLRTAPEAAEQVRRFLKVKPQRLTRAALETLAIVAYRQPVTRPEIEDIRAVDCGAVLKALLERRLLKIIGKREEPGRPLLYGTSKEFLEFFNLRDLASLPTLREFQELTEESRGIVEKEIGEPLPIQGIAGMKDESFGQKLAESSAEADAALAELETALADTEKKSAMAAESLKPVEAPTDGVLAETK